ncbi:MAG TPA: HlyD family efflux transporter periplasmic adaptor subunit [Alphaproteobacteria bacterium]|nr:HlyD family efflux transporter periplasmic adaptor subunit [Alphaproteobacteria bacterium]
MNGVLAWLAGLVAIVVPGFGATPAPSWNGYVEADYVYVSPVSGGTIASIPVREGQTVAAGGLLFTLEETQQVAALRGAEARVAAAKANLDNLMTGSRSAEIDVLRAALQKAVSDLGLAQTTASRTQDLFARGVATKAQLDQASAALKAAEAAVEQDRAQLKVAELPARDAQQAAAEANLGAAQADADAARAALADRTVAAPVAGRIERVYFDLGEMAAAGTPVVAILPADALKVKFYLPEADRDSFRLGDPVAVTCDGCPAGLTAQLSWFASDPEFTPPVIYSRDERQRLTFLAEATLSPGSALHPGQPVTVERKQ